MIGIEKTAFSEPNDWYKTEVSMVYIEGEWYVKSECTDIPGKSCNIPGSIHLVVIPTIWW